MWLTWCLQQQEEPLRLQQLMQRKAALQSAQQQKVHSLRKPTLWQQLTQHHSKGLAQLAPFLMRLRLHLRQHMRLPVQAALVVATAGLLLRLSQPRSPAAKPVLTAQQQQRMRATQWVQGQASASGSHQLATAAPVLLSLQTAASASSARHQTISPQQSGRHLWIAMQQQPNTAAQQGPQCHHHQVLLTHLQQKQLRGSQAHLTARSSKIGVRQ